MEQSTCLVLNYAFPLPGQGLIKVNVLAQHSARASNVSVAGPESMITWPGRWLGRMVALSFPLL